MRIGSEACPLPLAAAFLLAGCAAPAPTALQPVRPPADERLAGTPTPAQVLERSRAILLEDSEKVLGAAALAEVMRSPTAFLVRSSTSFPRMIRQPDGSFKPEPPGIAAAVRTGDGWVRIGATGQRTPIERPAGIQLVRLIAKPAFWSEAPTVSAPCTDPSGIIMLARHQGREFISPYPCGLTGLTGQAVRLVTAGRVSDWSKVDPDLRPAGLPLARFHEQTQARYRFVNGIYEERLIAIRSAAEWEGQWRRMMAPMRDPPPPPEVRFESEMLLMAGMGPRPSGGYVATIDKVIEQEEELLAFVRFTSPGPRCGAIAAVTSPLDIVRVPRSEKNVRFVVERQVTDCS